MIERPICPMWAHQRQRGARVHGCYRMSIISEKPKGRKIRPATA